MLDSDRPTSGVPYRRILSQRTTLSANILLDSASFTSNGAIVAAFSRDKLSLLTVNF